MTWSAPIERTISTLLVLHTPVTWAPNALANWTAKLPTPPEAPMTTTCWPGWTPPVSRSAWRAANPEIGTAAACSKLRLAGFCASWPWGTEAYSAKDPSHQPKTGSSPASVGGHRPGRGGHSPPTVSIASPIKASGDLNPNAIRVSRRILVLTDSTSPLDRPSVSAAWMPARCALIVLASLTNAGIRQRLAQASHASSSTVALTPLSLNTNRSSSFSRYARYSLALTRAIQASLPRWRPVRSSGFFHNANRAPLNSRARDVPPCGRAVFQTWRRTASSASLAHLTT